MTLPDLVRRVWWLGESSSLQDEGWVSWAGLSGGLGRQEEASDHAPQTSRACVYAYETSLLIAGSPPSN